MSPTVKWHLKADFLETCSCDFGCPCNFEAPPTKGYCAYVAAWHIHEGYYGDVRLDGLTAASAGRFPQAMHLGNGTSLLFIDERATQEQRQALLTLITGKAGGLPFEIFAAVISTWLEPRFVPIIFDSNGRHSAVKIGDVAEAALTPIKNPVTGEEEEIKLVLPKGFIWKEGLAVMSTVSRCTDPAMPVDQSGQSGYWAQVEYSN